MTLRMRAVWLALYEIIVEVLNLYAAHISNSDILSKKDLRWRRMCLDAELTKVKLRRITKLTLSWIQQDFLKKNKKLIPQTQGVYMFVVNINNGIDMNSCSNHILYVGQASNLRDRFGQYFGYAKSGKPSDFLKRCMVLIWKGKLTFHYFETKTLTKEELTEVEFDIIDSIVPPLNQRFRGTILKKHVKLLDPRS